MNKETLAALDASIKHWEENAKATSVDDASVGASDCALCRKFHAVFKRDYHADAMEKSCCGCPIEKATGRKFCEETPFTRAETAHKAWFYSEAGGRAGRAFRIAAHGQLSFLKAIRPIGL